MTTPKIKRQKNLQNNKQSFSDHVQELRNRILLWVLVLIAATMVGYFLKDKILAILLLPYNRPIFYTNPAGGFDFALKISLFFGFLCSLPVLVYQVLKFVEPALPVRIPRLFITVMLSSLLLMSLGVSFAYFISLPGAIYFLNKFSTPEIGALVSTTEYFSFVTRYLVGFGLVFQLPLILLAINYVRKISLRKLLSLEKWVVLISFALAAIITPTPDIFNQMVMAVPIIILYQASILIVWMSNKWIH